MRSNSKSNNTLSTPSFFNKNNQNQNNNFISSSESESEYENNSSNYHQQNQNHKKKKNLFSIINSFLCIKKFKLLISNFSIVLLLISSSFKVSQFIILFWMRNEMVNWMTW